MRGKLILVIGPMGSGKSTLMRHAIERFPELRTPYSYTTRPRRPDPVENEHYQFVSREEFEEKIRNNEFLEWAKFSDNYYGTLKEYVLEGIEEGKVMFKEMEVQGVRQVKAAMDPADLVTVFIDAGSWETLVERALGRSPMSEEELARRKAHFEEELTFMPDADVVIHNRSVEEKESAKEAFEQVIKDALDRAHR
ncbi:MAG TPA: guanylate kinase [Candidatus Paceibacterota bacterium]|nr:guanylate kinase [Candidatus Paceibacterota bacterium]